MSEITYPRPEAYLSHENARAVARFSDPLKMVMEQNGLTTKVDLVVEGGVETGITMAHIVRALFPSALYIGTDLTKGYHRVRQSMSDSQLAQIKRSNANPTFEMNGSMINANCLDITLIRDIAKQINAVAPMLVSFNALYALPDKNANPWTSKTQDDITPLLKYIDPDVPHVSQLHLVQDDVWKENREPILDNYANLEQAAKKSGWISERISNEMVDGLLIVRQYLD